jgi:hypothetical protein
MRQDIRGKLSIWTGLSFILTEFVLAYRQILGFYRPESPHDFPLATMLIRNFKTKQHALINYKMLNMIPESEGVCYCGCGVVQK